MAGLHKYKIAAGTPKTFLRTPPIQLMEIRESVMDQVVFCCQINIKLDETHLKIKKR